MGYPQLTDHRVQILFLVLLRLLAAGMARDIRALMRLAAQAVQVAVRLAHLLAVQVIHQAHPQAKEIMAV
jgi:hypothetical protein